MSRSARRWGLLLAIPLLLTSCNIFSWTHDAGSSDDPETLLKDAEDAFLAQDYAEALQYAEKGIANDPNLQFPRLRYVAAQAVLARSGISVSDYLNVFSDQGIVAKSRDGRRPGLRARALELSDDELRSIAESCPAAVRFLRELVDALEAGEISAADLRGIRFDVDLGFAIGTLLTAFVTVLDEDRNLDNGFVLDDAVTITSDAQAGYQLEYCPAPPTCPSDQEQREFARCELVCPFWYRSPEERRANPDGASFCEALEGIYDAYRTATGIDAPVDIGCNATQLGPKPTAIDDAAVIGQVLDFVYDGVRRLYRDYVQADGCTTCGGVQ